MAYLNGIALARDDWTMEYWVRRVSGCLRLFTCSRDGFGSCMTHGYYRIYKMIELRCDMDQSITLPTDYILSKFPLLESQPCVDHGPTHIPHSQ